MGGAGLYLWRLALNPSWIIDDLEKIAISGAVIAKQFAGDSTGIMGKVCSRELFSSD
jgi:hypothetical protein